ncbi:MAG: hypothetical protein HPY76_09845 [Anaerolineae bacterium]|nr:hypothetical protein [Anaerolineae bacterium]
MTRQRGPWYLLTGLVIGIVLGLVYGWLIDPVDYVDTSPDSLHPDFKNQYRSLIALAHQSSGDNGRAAARLALLGDDDPAAALAGQAQQLLAAGGSQLEAQALANLAADLRGQPQVATPVATITLPPAGEGTQEPPVATLPPGGGVSTATRVATLTITPVATFTPRRLPATPTRGAPFAPEGELVTVCDPFQPPGLLQVMVLDTFGEPLPGIRVEVSWAGGQDHFFTGLYPEISLGYGDFEMQAGVAYTVRVGEGGEALNNIVAPQCSGDSGVYTGGLEVTFSQ